MPSGRVDGPKVIVATYDIVGTDGVVRGFIRHTGLATIKGEHDQKSVPVSDMAPPLRPTAQIKADALGTAVLTEGEARKIKDFIDRHEGEHKTIQKLSRATIAQVYCLLPHSCPLSETDGRYVRQRFSCAGYVFDAYKRTGMSFLHEDQLPTIDLSRIKEAYPDYASLLDRSEFRESMGLAGAGPWPVMLCGYLLSSLKRSAAELRAGPYTVQLGDEVFL